MQKIKKYIFCFALLITLTSLVALLVFCPTNKIFAFELNVDHPKIPSGDNSSITSRTTVPEYLKYVFDFGIFISFIAVIISLAVAGIYYFISPAIPSALEKAKDRIFGSFAGMLILLLLYLIITTINPALSFFRSEPLKSDPLEIITKPLKPGIYLYKTDNCFLPQGLEPIIKSQSESDLGELKGLIQSATIVPNYELSNYFISILFESKKYWGKCFYIDPTASCNKIYPPFASSISIYQYNFNPQAGDITIFREPFYNQNGGYFRIFGPQTKNIYVESLENLTFMKNQNGDLFDPDNCTVPKEKMDCIQWDNKGLCTKKKCPNLSEKNIGSIRINGEYVILLAYVGPNDNAQDGPWSLCQAFPTSDDKIGIGPNKIKWEVIKNENRLPNFLLIFPVEDNTNPDTSRAIDQ